jgi:hypothetical protein
MQRSAVTFRDSESILSDLCGQSADVESTLAWLQRRATTSERNQLLLKSLSDLQATITQQLFQYTHLLSSETRHKFHQYSRETIDDTNMSLTEAAKTSEGIVALVLEKNQAILNEIIYMSEKEVLERPQLEFESLQQLLEQHLHDISRRGQTINDI